MIRLGSVGTVAVLAILFLGPVPSTASSGGCSTAGVAGFYGFTYTGVAILPSGAVPLAAVGNYSTDAAGNFAGSEINSLGGTSAYQTLQGTITVNQNCSGTAVVKVYQGGKLARTSYIHLQYDNSARDIRIIFQKLQLPDGSSIPVVITGDGKKVSDSDR
jgi:hypothetical protein